jgi:hypothetical protein
MRPSSSLPSKGAVDSLDSFYKDAMEANRLVDTSN